MSDLISLEKAAKLLGLTADQLNEMRLKNEIFGTRDGASWKFKLDELQRVADDKGISLPAAGNVSDSGEMKLSDDALELTFDSSEDLSADLDSGSVLQDAGSDNELSFGESDISLASGSDVLDDEPADEGSPSDTGKLLGDSGDLELSEDDLFDDDLSLKDSQGLLDSSELSSDFEDSDLVLEDSDSSDDPAIDVEGMNLGPTESGISMDEPFDAGGSDIDDLELPDDDDVIALEESVGDSAFLKSDDDFNLTPLEDDSLDDSSSGSQVIALEDSAIYTDDSAPTMLGEDDATFDESAPAMIDEFKPEGELAGMGAVAIVPESPYSLWNILSLALALLIVVMGTMVAFDLVRNMWQPTDTTLSSTVANFFISLAGFEA